MNAKEIRGKEMHDTLERINFLEKKAKNGEVSEPESREYHELLKQFRLLSFEDLKEYHDFMVSRVKEGHIKKEMLIGRIKAIGTPNVQQFLERVIEEVYEK